MGGPRVGRPRCGWVQGAWAKGEGGWPRVGRPRVGRPSCGWAQGARGGGGWVQLRWWPMTQVRVPSKGIVLPEPTFDADSYSV